MHMPWCTVCTRRTAQAAPWMVWCQVRVRISCIPVLDLATVGICRWPTWRVTSSGYDCSMRLTSSSIECLTRGNIS